MKIGDRRMETPHFGMEAKGEAYGPHPCRVVRIHPEKRFYTVEFASDVTGETFRESYYFTQEELKHDDKR